MRVPGAVVALTVVLVACSTDSHDSGMEIRDAVQSPDGDLGPDHRPVDSRGDTPALSDTPHLAEVLDVGDSTESELLDERGDNDSAPEVDVCTPACENKQCGQDGCGGQCGQCEEGSKCVDGNCEDVPVVEDLIIIHGDSKVEPRNVVVDTVGNVLVAATSWGGQVQVSEVSSPLGESEKGLFLMKLDQDLQPLWWKPTGANSTGSQYGFEALDAGPEQTFVVANHFDKDDTVDLGGGVLPAYLAMDVFAGALTGDGEHLWSTSMAGSSYEYAAGLAADGSGGAYLTGHTNSKLGLDLGDETPEIPSWADDNPYLVRYDATGTPVWSKLILSSKLEWGVAVATAASGGVYWAVRAGSSFDLGGDYLSAISDSDLVLAAFTADGSHVWSKRFGVPEWSGKTWVESAILSNDSLVLVGRMGANIDLGCGPMAPDEGYNSVIVAAKLDSQGECVWSKVLGNGLAKWLGVDKPGLEAFSIAVDDNDQIYVGGSYTAPLDLGGGPLDDYAKGGVVVKLDESGNHVWSLGISEHVVSVDVGPDGAVYAVTTVRDELKIRDQVYPNPTDAIDPITGGLSTSTVLVKLSQ